MRKPFKKAKVGRLLADERTNGRAGGQTDGRQEGADAVEERRQRHQKAAISRRRRRINLIPRLSLLLFASL